MHCDPFHCWPLGHAHPPDPFDCEPPGQICAIHSPIPQSLRVVELVQMWSSIVPATVHGEKFVAKPVGDPLWINVQ